MIHALLKLLLITLEYFKYAKKQERKQEFKDNVEKIKRDPVAAWNAKFTRVQVVDGDRRRNDDDVRANRDADPPASS